MPQRKAISSSNSPEGQFLISTCAALVGIIVLGFFLIPKEQTSERTTSQQKEIAKEEKPRIIEPIIKLDALPSPLLSAKAIYAIDITTNKVLFSKNENEPILPASTTKIATALVSLSHYSLDQVLTVGKINVNSHTMGLRTGEKITTENLLYGLLIYSANDAAEVLARNYSGGRENFVNAMNTLAETQELKNTHFTNPAGFDEYLHFSSAKDLTQLAKYAINNPTFSKIVATPKYTAKNQDGTIKYELANTNKLLKEIPGVTGIKTGRTDESDESLVTLISRDNHSIIISLLGSKDRFGETKTLLEWIFTNYEWK